VPEEWARSERSRDAIAGVVRLAAGALLVLLAFGGAVSAIVAWSRRRFTVGVFLRVAGVVLVAGWAGAANAWPVTQGRFATAVPYRLEAFMAIVSNLLFGAVLAGASGLMAGLNARWVVAWRAFDRLTALIFGVGLGLAVTAIGLVSARLPGAEAVHWPSFAEAGTFVPAIGLALSPVAYFAFATTLLLFAFGGANVATAGWTRRRTLLSVALAFFGAAVGAFRADPLSTSLATLAATSVLYAAAAVAASRWILRFDLAPIPIAVATVLVLAAAQGAWARPFPGAIAGYALGAIVTLGLLRFWWPGRDAGA
jgi:hypothetical protein